MQIRGNGFDALQVSQIEEEEEDALSGSALLQQVNNVSHRRNTVKVTKKWENETPWYQKQRPELLWESTGAKESMSAFLTMKKSIWKIIRSKRDVEIKKKSWRCALEVRGDKTSSIFLLSGVLYCSFTLSSYLESVFRTFFGVLIVYPETTSKNNVTLIYWKSITPSGRIR